MKKVILLIIFSLTTILAFSVEIDSELKKVDKLIVEKQYLDAINMINDLGKLYEDPQLIHYKVKITISGFATSLNHKMFGYKNLGEEENIYEVRRDGGEFTMVFGDLEEEIKEAINKHPKSYIVYEAAGDYYSDVSLRYGDQLEYSYQDLNQKIVSFYKKSYELGNEKKEVIADIGEYSLYLELYDQGEKFYRMALPYDTENPDYNYNLSFALENLGRFEEALGYSKTAIEYYHDKDLKADAFQMHAYQNDNLGNIDEAIKNYLLALESNSSMFYSQQHLIINLLSQNDLKKANKYTSDFIILNIRDFDKILSLMRIYFQAEKVDAIERILIELDEKLNDSLDKGTVHYHLGVLYNSVGKNASKELLKARDFYSEKLDADHSIFKKIDEFLNNLET